MVKISEFATDAKGSPRSVAEVTTSAGTRIFLLPVETFPNHVNNVYLIDDGAASVLVDVGTIMSQGAIEGRLVEVGERFGVERTLRGLTEAVITHAHFDHFSNAHALRELGVPIAIHELDSRVLETFRERLLLVSRDIEIFLSRAGLRAERVAHFKAIHLGAKDAFAPIQPDRYLREGDLIAGKWPVVHVPGHCPGLICIIVDDVVLTGDHLLARTTPLQSPHSITPFMGLSHYLDSLVKLRDRGPFALALGAHEAPMPNVARRIDETITHHRDRLARVLGLCHETPSTIDQISRALFGSQQGYGVLLALFETAAHVEYLHELGYLRVDNLDEVVDDLRAAPRYAARPEKLAKPLLVGFLSGGAPTPPGVRA
ncbi:MAG: MBL fold metallo-hydrolase [Candidatus Schekmanbacteria bacterium]|nr:MBL fold metallo-hydrolase [Candidatus Schekmanbacteria bacterium]